jgi:hypothetical protein
MQNQFAFPGSDGAKPWQQEKLNGSFSNQQFIMIFGTAPVIELILDRNYVQK